MLAFGYNVKIVYTHCSTMADFCKIMFLWSAAELGCKTSNTLSASLLPTERVEREEKKNESSISNLYCSHCVVGVLDIPRRKRRKKTPEESAGIGA